MHPPAALRTNGAAFFTGGGIIPCSSCQVSFTLAVKGLMKSTSTFTFGCSFISRSFAWPSARPFFETSVTVFHQGTFAPPAPAPPPAAGGGISPAMSITRARTSLALTIHRAAGPPPLNPPRGREGARDNTNAKPRDERRARQNTNVSTENQTDMIRIIRDGGSRGGRRLERRTAGDEDARRPFAFVRERRRTAGRLHSFYSFRGRQLRLVRW